MPALIGALRVSLSADTAKFHDGMKRAERQARTTGSAIQKSLGLMTAGLAGLASGLSIGLITRGIRAGLDYAGSLKEVAQQLGVTTRDLQVFRYAAGQTGVKQEQLETGLSKLTITLGKVAAGAKAPAAALAAIGISIDDVKGKDTGEVFRMIADGLSKVTDRSQRAAVEVALFGRAGSQLDNLLADGSGAINELASAAEKLGIVLSDEQIQKADDTADKLDALQTVLTARIAGQVADNADSILALADALVTLVSAAGAAIGALSRFFAVASQPLPALGGKSGLGAIFGFLTNPAGTASRIGMGLGQQAVGATASGGRSVTIDLPPAKAKAAPAGIDISKFLASAPKAPRAKRGGASDDAERKRLEALRNAFQFEEEQRRADIEILRAKQQLATDYVDRTSLSIQILNLEKEGFEEELKYRIASKDLTKAQADELRARFEIKDGLERQAVLADEEADRLRDYNRLAEVDFDLQRERLESEAQLAETAAERRDVELRLLDLVYRQERARLQAIIADEKSGWAAQEEARRRLLNLDKLQSNDRQDVINSTRGPMEDWLASLPTTAAKAQEAFESLQVQGFEGLIDAALELSNGFDSAKDALLNTLKQFLLGLIKMQLQQGLSSVLGGIPIPQFATGGFTGMMGRNRIAGVVHGQEGVLNATAMQRLGVPALNALNRGMPISAVSNDNGRSGSGDIHIHGVSDFDSFRRNETQVRRQARRVLGIQ